MRAGGPRDHRRRAYRGDLVSFLGTRRSKIRVVPLGVGEAFSRAVAAHVAPRPTCSMSATIAATRILQRSLRRGRRSRRFERRPLHHGPRRLRWRARAPQRPDTRDNRFGRDPQRRTRVLLRGSDGARAPSLREGFGLPMLEAMAAGCPVVACEDSLPRVLDSAALSFKAETSTGCESSSSRYLPTRVRANGRST